MKKKLLAAALVLSVVLGGAYYYSDSSDLQGRFGSKITNSTKTVKSGSSSSSSSSSSTSSTFQGDFELNEESVTYSSSLNYLQAVVCSTLNGGSASPKLSFTLNGKTNTVTIAAQEGCVRYTDNKDMTSYYGIKSAGAREVSLSVDTTSAYSETDETNNSFSATLAFTSNAYLSGQFIDLSLESLDLPQSQNVLKPTICVDEEVALTAPLYLSYVIKDSSNRTVSDIDYALHSRPGLSSLIGDCTEVEIVDPNIGVFGDDEYTVTMELDSKNYFSETNESNNSAKETSMSW